jgi:ubiquinone/menaquinone biosynthesis C-methylase UbiE
VGQAHGETIAIDPGTGLNLGHYRPAVTRMVLCEPDGQMARRLAERVEQVWSGASVVEASAEALPFEANSVDTAVVTPVLCSVSDPQKALSEIRPVLVPGATFLFFEHVRAQTPRLAGWQDRLAVV